MLLRPCVLAVLTLLIASCDRERAAPAPVAPAKVDAKEIIRGAVWTRKPTQADVEALRPAAAANLKLSAVANLWCVAQADGTLGDCRSEWQDPPGLGLDEAALQAAALYRIAPADNVGLVEGRPVEVRFTWKGKGG